MLWIANLWAGDDSPISHGTAAALWRFGNRGDLVDVAGNKKNRPPRGIKNHFVGEWAPGDLCRREGLLVTTPARTLIEIAGADDLPLVASIDEALRLRLTSIQRIESRLGRLGTQGRSGSRRLSEVIKELKQDTLTPRSLLERRFMRRLAKESLPLPEREYAIYWRGRRFFFDFAFRDAAVAIETDSFAWHTDPSAWKRDLAKRNAAAVLGWKLIHATWADLDVGLDDLVEDLHLLLVPKLSASAVDY